MEQSAPLRTLHAVLGGAQHVDFVQRLGGCVLVLLTANTCCNWLLQVATNRYAASCQTRLARELLEECVDAPYSWFLTRNSTTLGRFFYDDVAQLTRGFSQRLLAMARAALNVLIGAALILAFAPVTGLLALSLLGSAAALLTVRVRPLLTRLSREKRAALDRTMLAAAHVLGGIKDVKLSSRAQSFVGVFVDSYRVTARTHGRLNVWQQFVPLSLSLLA